MDGIRVFVAHSFNDEDKALVSVFVEHFENLARAYPGFSWDHAEQAEAAPLSEKVLAKIEDKNVFIGICTRSEYAVDAKHLSNIPLVKSLLVNQTNLEWKTSDWIIQEIGLAVGRKMSVILFLEERVRRPGGLFGDIEHISFSRANPHASFDKLLQMLVALSPKESSSSLVAVQTKPAETEQQKELPSSLEDWEPKADWDQEKFDRALVWAILVNRDEGHFDRIDKAYRAADFAQKEALLIWRSRAEYFRMLAGGKGDFSRIKRLADENPDDEKLTFYLGKGYEQLEEHEIAAHTFERAASIAREQGDKLRYLSEAACEYVRADLKSRAREIEERIKEEVEGNGDWQNGLFLTLQELAEIEKDDAFQLAVMEQRAEMRPDDTVLRFSLAYKHSKAGNSEMALYHYLKIHPSQRDAVTWNNLGVSFDGFGMPVKSIGAYRTSADKNETLAMSNLGFKLLNAGFIEEAQRECDRALAIKSYHKNIAELIKRLKEVPEEEEDKLRDTLEKVRPKAMFFRRLGEAIGKKTPVEIASKWNSSDGILDAKISGASLVLSGSQEQPANALYSQLLGARQTIIQRTEYSGKLRGHVFFGKVNRKREGEAQSLLSLGGAEVMMYLSADLTELHAVESPQSINPNFYTLTRVA